MACKVKVNRHGFLAFRLYFNGMESWEGTEYADTVENRRLLEPHALTISHEIKKGSFDYLQFFPNGNKAHLFRRHEDMPATLQTIEGYFRTWIKQQSGHVRPHRLKDYNSTIDGHVLKTRIGGQLFGKIPLSLVKVTDLKALQSSLEGKRAESRQRQWNRSFLPSRHAAGCSYGGSPQGGPLRQGFL
jgi:hypothetical protein